jgi:hypothetical protein
MGWSSMEHYGRKTADLVKEDLGSSYEIVERSGVTNGVLYLAVKHLKGEKEGLVSAVAVLYRRDKVWLTTKWVSEEMGPYESTCPAKVLDKLSPVCAQEWRDRCRKHLAKPKAHEGDTVVFVSPYEFTDGVKEHRFTYLGKGTLFRRDCDGGRVRLGRGWKERDYGVVDAKTGKMVSTFDTAKGVLPPHTKGEAA